MVQGPFQRPLTEERELRLQYFPKERFPPGNIFFEHPYEEGYPQLDYEDIVIVHNNWIVGHDSKRERFQQHHLWNVGDNAFPSCRNSTKEKNKGAE